MYGILCCNAFYYDIGSVLSYIANEYEKPVAYALCTLNKSERNYTRIDKEALPMIFGGI